MIDSYEVLMGRISNIASEGLMKPSSPVAVRMFSFKSYHRERFLALPLEGQQIEVGAGGHRKGLHGSVRRNETVFWVKDRSVSPPVTRWLLSTMAGTYVGKFEEGTDESQRQQPLHHSDTREATAIVEEAHQLLDLFDPKHIVTSNLPIVLNDVAVPTLA